MTNKLLIFSVPCVQYGIKFKPTLANSADSKIAFIANTTSWQECLQHCKDERSKPCSYWVYYSDEFIKETSALKKRSCALKMGPWETVAAKGPGVMSGAKACNNMSKF